MLEQTSLPNWMIEDEADEYLATLPNAAEDLIERVPRPLPVLQISERQLRANVRNQTYWDFSWKLGLSAPPIHNRAPDRVLRPPSRETHRGD